MNRAQFDSQRRRAIKTMGVVLFVEVAMLTGAYFTSAERMRSFCLVVGLILLGITIASMGAVIAVYHQASKKIDKDE
jgi:hypothetical protein